MRDVAFIDLFCGAGGLTHGLIKAGVPVVAGIDGHQLLQRLAVLGIDVGQFVRQRGKPQALLHHGRGHEEPCGRLRGLDPTHVYAAAVWCEQYTMRHLSSVGESSRRRPA